MNQKMQTNGDLFWFSNDGSQKSINVRRIEYKSKNAIKWQLVLFNFDKILVAWKTFWLEKKRKK